MIRIGLVDDHKLLLEGLKELISSFEHCLVVFTGSDVGSVKEYLSDNADIDILFLDVNIGKTNGIDHIAEIVGLKPDLKVVMLTMSHHSPNIIKSIKAGAVGYLLKDAEPEVLYESIIQTKQNGFYYTKEVNDVIMGSLRGESSSLLSDQERIFLTHACTEATYKEIATKMNVSPRTVDGYRESLFAKLGVKNRVGLVLYAIKSGLLVIE